jgi:hypothetical protein
LIVNDRGRSFVLRCDPSEERFDDPFGAFVVSEEDVHAGGACLKIVDLLMACCYASRSEEDMHFVGTEERGGMWMACCEFFLLALYCNVEADRKLNVKYNGKRFVYRFLFWQHDCQTTQNLIQS